MESSFSEDACIVIKQIVALQFYWEDLENKYLYISIFIYEPLLLVLVGESQIKKIESLLANTCIVVLQIETLFLREHFPYVIVC